MSNSPYTRRSFVAATAGTGLAGLAGCLGGDSSGSDTEEMTDGMSTTEGMTDGMSTTEEEMMAEPTDPDSAPVAAVDRFSESAGTLHVRSDGNDLPGPDEPIDFDQAPFITRGLGPDGDPHLVVVKSTVVPGTTDTVVNVWNTFEGEPYRPSVSYLATPVTIEPREPSGGERVTDATFEEYLRTGVDDE